MKVYLTRKQTTPPVFGGVAVGYQVVPPGTLLARLRGIALFQVQVEGADEVFEGG